MSKTTEKQDAAAPLAELPQAPSLIIPREHQSSPKDRPIDKAVRNAMQEIHDGTYIPEPEKKENIFGVEEDEFWVTGTELLAAHPRVADAMRDLEQQVSDKKCNEFIEKAEQLHELNAMLRAGHKWDGQTRWQGKENEEMRLVNLMSPKRFIEKLQAAGISAAIEPKITKKMLTDPETGRPRWFEAESSDSLIWLGRSVVRGVVGLYAWVDAEAKYINKLQAPTGPEWTLMRFDDYDLPTNERYHGWRTAVLALIFHRVITERQAELAFGKVVENDASAYYRQQLYEFRNADGPKA